MSIFFIIKNNFSRTLNLIFGKNCPCGDFVTYSTYKDIKIKCK